MLSPAHAGIRYVVGTLGTAYSEEQLRRLGSITRKIIWCFEGDDVGRAAAVHRMHTALPHLGELDEVAFMFLPIGHDLDPFVRAHDAQALLEIAALANSAEILLYETLVQDVDSDSVGDLARLGARARTVDATIIDPVIQRRIVARLTEFIDMPWYVVDY